MPYTNLLSINASSGTQALISWKFQMMCLAFEIILIMGGKSQSNRTATNGQVILSLGPQKLLHLSSSPPALRQNQVLPVSRSNALFTCMRFLFPYTLFHENLET